MSEDFPRKSKIGVEMPIIDQQDLEKKHPLYTQFVERWKFFGASYEGVEALKALNKFPKHPRESEENYEKRMDNLYGFNYSQAVIDLVNFYLFNSKFIRNFEVLENDQQFQKFLFDADLEGNDYDKTIKQNARDAGIYGAVGVLVDKASRKTDTLAQEIEAGIYPYLSSYVPTAIWDWHFVRDEQTARPVLSYIKLVDGNGDIRVWTRTEWEVWKTIDSNTNTQMEQPEIISSGENTLGEIPFTFQYSDQHPRFRQLGLSMIKDIAQIDLSITKNLSDGEEIFEFASFPMMRKPKRQSAKADTNQDATGASAILEFDPALGNEGKPDWLTTEVAQPISAILSWIGRKESAIYRMSNTGSIFNSDSNAIPSGRAFEFMFSQLESNLSKKADNTVEAEKNIIRYWLMWQNKVELLEEIDIQAPETFAIKDLMESLQNIMSAMSIVRNDTFDKEARKLVASETVPLSVSKQAQVNEEIDAEEETEPEEIPEDIEI